MMYPLKISDITPQIDYFDEVQKLVITSTDYLKSQKWCERIINGWIFVNLGYLLNIYVFEIENNQESDDNFVWIIAGDFPPIYVDMSSPDTKDALETYIFLAEDWIEAFENHTNLENVYPFEKYVNLDNLELFKKKVHKLKTTLIENIDIISLDQIGLKSPFGPKIK